MCGEHLTGTTPAFVLLLAVLAASCGRAESEAAAQTGEARLVACDLVTPAELATLLGPATAEPSSYQSDNASVCTFVGTDGAATLRTWQPFHGGGSDSAEWAARLQSERADDAERETDPELKRALAEVKIVPYERLGVPAAREDIFEQFALHAVKGGAGGVYVSVYASSLDVAHGIAEAALAKLP